MKQYAVEYHTTPAPGLTFYKGTIKVWAEDAEDARWRAKSELSRKASFAPSLIQVTSTKEV